MNFISLAFILFLLGACLAYFVLPKACLLYTSTRLWVTGRINFHIFKKSFICLHNLPLFFSAAMMVSKKMRQVNVPPTCSRKIFFILLCPFPTICDRIKHHNCSFGGLYPMQPLFHLHLTRNPVRIAFAILLTVLCVGACVWLCLSPDMLAAAVDELDTQEDLVEGGAPVLSLIHILKTSVFYSGLPEPAQLRHQTILQSVR